MRLYKVSSNEIATVIRETKLKKEKDLQAITEKNLQTIFELEFICSEFQVGNLRIDTLAFNPESKSFVIIEYKISQSSGVIDQGFAYLGLMLERKAEFVNMLSQHMNKVCRKQDIAWDQSRVYFVSTFFNNHQQGILCFNDLPISLWEIRAYDGGYISFDQLEYGGRGSSFKISGITSPFLSKVTKQVKVWTEEDHLARTNDDIRNLYELLKDRILEMGAISIEPKAKYLAFKSRTNVVDVVVQNTSLVLFLNVKKGILVDNMNLAKDVSAVGHWGNGDYKVILRNDQNILNVLSLVEQSFKINQ